MHNQFRAQLAECNHVPRCLLAQNPLQMPLGHGKTGGKVPSLSDGESLTKQVLKSLPLFCSFPTEHREVLKNPTPSFLPYTAGRKDCPMPYR